MKTQYAISPKDIRVTIGPGILKCHFKIWPETRHKGVTRFRKLYTRFLRKENKKLFLDLEGIIKQQLQQNGIPFKNIHSTGECTYHLPRKYFSFRRDANSKHSHGLGNMLSVIGFGGIK